MVVIIIQVPINSKTWCDYDFQLQVVQEDTSCGSLQMVDQVFPSKLLDINIPLKDY